MGHPARAPPPRDPQRGRPQPARAGRHLGARPGTPPRRPAPQPVPWRRRTRSSPVRCSPRPVRARRRVRLGPAARSRARPDRPARVRPARHRRARRRRALRPAAAHRDRRDRRPAGRPHRRRRALARLHAVAARGGVRRGHHAGAPAGDRPDVRDVRAGLPRRLPARGAPRSGGGDPLRRAAGAGDDERARAGRRHLRASTPCSSPAGPARGCRCGSRPAAPGAPGPTGSSCSSPARTRSTRSWCTTPRPSSTPPSRPPSSTRRTPTSWHRTCAPPPPSCPLRTEELELFGPRTADLLAELVERGALRRRPSGWYWTHNEQASRLTDLRGSGGDPVRVVESVTGRLLGTVDAASADATVHPGAVYVHQGASFVVDELRLEDGVALVTRRDVDYGTWARWVTTTEIQSVDAEVPLGTGHLGVRVGRRDHPGPRLPAQTHPGPAGARHRGARPARAHAAHDRRLVDRARRGPPGRRASPSRPPRAPCTPPSTRPSASCRCSRRATAGTSAGCRPRCTSTPSRPPSSCTTPTPAARASPNAASRSVRPGCGRPATPSPPAAASPGAPRASSRPSAATRTTRSTRPPRSACSTRSSRTHRRRLDRPRRHAGADRRPAAARVTGGPRSGRPGGRRRGTGSARHHDPHRQHTGALVRAGREPPVVAADHLRDGRARVARVPGQEPGRSGERAEVRRRLRPPAGELRGGQEPEHGRRDEHDRHEREQQDRAGSLVVPRREAHGAAGSPSTRGGHGSARATAVARARSGEPPHGPGPTGRDLDRDPLAGARHRDRASSPASRDAVADDVAVRLPERCRPGPRPCGVGAARLRDRRRRDRQQRDQQQHDHGQTDRELGGDAPRSCPPAPVTATAPGG